MESRVSPLLRPYLSLSILIPMSVAGNCEVTSQMVREVNQTQVSPEEILSDHVYQFNRETGEIIMQEEEKHE